MAWVERHFKALAVLLGVGMASLLVKQGIAIADHGVTGWLRGDGAYQTEWEVRAVVGLLLVALPTAMIGALVRLGEGPLRRLKELRWERAVRRSRRG